MKTTGIKVLVFIMVALMADTGFAQSDTHLSGKAKWMDFWVGSWNLTWKDKDGNVERGINEVEKTLDGNVIQENFKALSGANAGFTGKSWTVFNVKNNSFNQTWVDNNGSYLDFTFTMDADKRVFKRTTKDKDGNTVYQRMVFYNVEVNDFDWNWESSKDGTTWNLLWKIHYERILAPAR
ncbi:MAG: hypothetical protein KJO64_03655 [Bacteroidia bacterium]|nr:hypothetical protein [Bacteroidia bacterium]NNC86604.1 hypothetical protein [Bacteroidia bacterium]